MTRIFVSHAKENADCAEQVRKELEGRGYVVWREPGYPGPENVSYPSMIENALLGSAALILVWSSQSVQAAWCERHVLFAQYLNKPIFPLVLDHTSLPSTLVAVSPVASQDPCTNAVASLVALPDFPPPQSTHPLVLLSEQAAHEFVSQRKAAIDQAAEMLRHDECREAVLAVLEYLAKHDLMMGVREKAQKVLDAEERKSAPPSPLLQPGDSRHIFGVRCKNGHVSYFDKRIVCTAYKNVPRSLKTSAGKEVDELHLKCLHQGCGLDVVASVDCGDYK